MAQTIGTMEDYNVLDIRRKAKDIYDCPLPSSSPPKQEKKEKNNTGKKERGTGRKVRERHEVGETCSGEESAAGKDRRESAA